MAKPVTAVAAVKSVATGLPSERLTTLKERWFGMASFNLFPESSASVEDYLKYGLLTCHVLLTNTRARVGRRTVKLNGHYRVPAEEANKIWSHKQEKSTTVVVKEPDGIGEIETGYGADDLRVMREEVERFGREHLGFGRKDASDSQPAQSLSGADSKPLRPSQLARESVRAVAALLWEQHPTLNIQEMIDRPELTRFGLELGKHRGYTRGTLYEWIHDLCPNPKPGRPRKED